MAIVSIMKSNLKSKKGNFISILVLIFIIGLSLTTIISVNTGFSERLNKAGVNSNSGDYLAFMREPNYKEDILDKFREFKEISRAENQKAVSASKLIINGKQEFNAVFFTAYAPNLHEYEIYKENLLAFKKDNHKMPKKGEIFVPVSYQNLYGCKPGDVISVETNAGMLNYRIAEFIEEPMIGSSTIGMKMIFLNEEDFNKLYSVKDDKTIYAYRLLRLFLEDSYKDRTASLSVKLNEKTNFINDSIFVITKQEANNYSLLFTKVIGGILWAFAILLFIIVLIIIGHSVGSSIEMDYVMFGILKSQGFTTLQIRMVILAQYLLAGVIGSILGILGSSIIIKYINRIFIPITGVLNNGNIKFFESMGVLLILLALITVYTYLKTRKITLISPVQAISCGHAPVYFSGHFDFSVTNPVPLPISIKLIWKNILGNIRRYISTIIIMAILVFFTMTVTTFEQTTSKDNTDEIYGNLSSDVYVWLKTNQEDVMQEIIADINRISPIMKEYKASGGNYCTVDRIQYLGLVIDKPETLGKPLKGRRPKYDNEVILTEMMSEEIGKKIGDTVTIKYKEKEAEYMIVGLNQSTSDAGKSFSILLSGIKRIAPDYKMRGTDYVLKDHKKSGEIVAYLKEKYNKYGDNIEIVDEYKRSCEETKTIYTAVDAITAITYILAIIFAAIVTFMMCQKAFLREQLDLGIFKSVGFTTGNLRGQFTVRYLIVVILGSLLGMSANFLWNDSLMCLLLRNIGMSQFKTVYTPSIILIPILCICSFTVLFSWIVSRRIKKVSPKNLIQE